LSAAEQVDSETIHLLQKEIDQLKLNVFEVEGFLIDQHKLNFDIVLQQVKYFYKIPFDEGNFDVCNEINGKWKVAPSSIQCNPNYLHKTSQLL